MTSRILIADDEPNILISLEYLMKRAGHEVLVARDGQEALDLLRAHHPRLLLLDVMMPRKTGFEVCAELRAAGLRYVALCDWTNTGAHLIRMAPESLAAALASETPPPWLRPIKMNTPLRLLEVVGDE